MLFSLFHRSQTTFDVLDSKYSSLRFAIFYPRNAELYRRSCRSDHSSLPRSPNGFVYAGPSLTTPPSAAKVGRMKIDSEDFRVRSEKKVKLKNRPTRVRAFFSSKNDYRRLLEEHTQQL